MTAVAISGHQDLDVATRRSVRALLDQRLATTDELVGLSSLAVGADSLFAASVLGCGGRLVAVIPADDYADGFSGAAADQYASLLAAANEVVRLPHARADEQAY